MILITISSQVSLSKFKTAYLKFNIKTENFCFEFFIVKWLNHDTNHGKENQL